MTSSGRVGIFLPVKSSVRPEIGPSGLAERASSPPTAFFQASRTRAMTCLGEIGVVPTPGIETGAGAGAETPDVSLRWTCCCDCDDGNDGSCCCPCRVGGVRRELIVSACTCASACAGVSGSRLLVKDAEEVDNSCTLSRRGRYPKLVI